MKNRQISNRVIAYEAARTIARFLYANLDNAEEKRELKSVMSGFMIPNRSVLNWLEDRGRRAHTVLCLDISPKDPEGDDGYIKHHAMKVLLKICIECISNYPNDHPCFKEYLESLPALITTEDAMETYQQLDEELEKAKFAQEEECDNV